MVGSSGFVIIFQEICQVTQLKIKLRGVCLLTLFVSSSFIYVGDEFPRNY